MYNDTIEMPVAENLGNIDKIMAVYTETEFGIELYDDIIGRIDIMFDDIVLVSKPTPVMSNDDYIGLIYIVKCQNNHTHKVLYDGKEIVKVID